MAKNNSAILTHFFLLAISSTIIGYVVIANLAPLGIITEEIIPDLGPKNRVEKDTQNGQTIFRQKDDIIYFTSKMPFQYDSATVRLTFKNPNPEQVLSLGFQDQQDWHYNLQVVDLPLLDSLTWNKIGDTPILYQQQKKYNSVSDFLNHLPTDSLIGVYNYDGDLGNLSDVKLSGYAPQKNETIIDTPLRGKHIMYTYLYNEPFHLTIEKQNLNWYKNSDDMTVTVYKNNNIVFEKSVTDDNKEDGSRKLEPPQKITIDNPGPDLPENGIYKIVIDANQDTIIKRISTNLHKIVFQGSIFPTENSQAYPGIVATTSATTVYTNTLALSASTYHTAGEQTILVGNQKLQLNSPKSIEILSPQEDFTKVIAPQSDVILTGFQGYFAFDPNQYFLPTNYHIIPITKAEDLDLVDYVLTDYTPAKQEGIWQTTERTFDITSAYKNNGMLSWIIESPKLAYNNRQVIIKNIEITFRKKPWI